MPIFTRFRDDARGATAVEYALLCALIAAVMIAGVAAMGSSITTHFFTPIGNALS